MTPIYTDLLNYIDLLQSFCFSTLEWQFLRIYHKVKERKV